MSPKSVMGDPGVCMTARSLASDGHLKFSRTLMDYTAECGCRTYTFTVTVLLNVEPEGGEIVILDEE